MAGKKSQDYEEHDAVIETDIISGRKVLRAVGHAIISDDLNMQSFGFVEGI